MRASPKTYYYIDYIHFCNVVKWRVWRMQKRIDSSTRNVSLRSSYATQRGFAYAKEHMYACDTEHSYAHVERPLVFRPLAMRFISASCGAN